MGGKRRERSKDCTPARKCKISILSVDGGGRAVQGAGGKGEPERTKCTPSQDTASLSLEFWPKHLEKRLRCDQNWTHHTDACIHSARRE